MPNLFLTYTTYLSFLGRHLRLRHKLKIYLKALIMSDGFDYDFCIPEREGKAVDLAENVLQILMKI